MSLQNCHYKLASYASAEFSISIMDYFVDEWADNDVMHRMCKEARRIVIDIETHLYHPSPG